MNFKIIRLSERIQTKKVGRGSKLKYFRVQVSLWKGCVNFFLPAVIQRWAWLEYFLEAKQRHFSLMLITWEAGFPEMGHCVLLFSH